MTFRIKEAREKMGWTQKELAEKIGVAQNTLHGYETGKHDPKSDFLMEIARLCEVTVDFLLGLEDEKPEPDDAMLFALWAGDDADMVDAELMADVKAYFRFKLQQKKDKKA